MAADVVEGWKTPEVIEAIGKLQAQAVGEPLATKEDDEGRGLILRGAPARNFSFASSCSSASFHRVGSEELSHVLRLFGGRWRSWSASGFLGLGRGPFDWASR